MNISQLIKILSFTSFLSLVLVNSNAHASYPVQIGQTTLSVFGVKLYDAALYAAMPDKYSLDDPISLTIEYHVSINKNRLIKQTKKQWGKIGVNKRDAQIWASKLQPIWVDVKKGDRLSVDHMGCFAHNEKNIGCYQDQEFIKAFFSIWLGERTQFPSHRMALLGLK